MKRLLALATCVSLLSLALDRPLLSAAPATQPPAPSGLDEQNRSLRDALADLTLKNQALEAENTRLKAQVKALQEKLARSATPQAPAVPFRYQMPNPVKPAQPLPQPAPKGWIPQRDGDVDFYIIPIRNKPE
jgi:hypothetical protein